MSKIIENIFYKQREDFYRKYKNRNKRFTFPEDITMTKGIPYATDGIKAHRLDIMEPSGTSPAEGWPVIINIHGGGLLLGSKEFNPYFCARLCTLGYLVFNVEYQVTDVGEHRVNEVIFTRSAHEVQKERHTKAQGA